MAMLPEDLELGEPTARRKNFGFRSKLQRTQTSRISTNEATNVADAKLHTVVMIQTRARGFLTRRKLTTLILQRTKQTTRAYESLENLDLFILPDVGLNLSVTYSNVTSGATEGGDSVQAAGGAGSFEVRGPPDRLSKICKVVGSENLVGGRVKGVISPKNSVTLPEEVKRAAGIPIAATYYAFVSPMKAFRQRLHRINLAQEPWAFACLLGAFAYFDDDGTLLAVNALTIVPAPAVLHLVGPYKPRLRASMTMERLGRMSPVTLDGLLDFGFQRFGWVHPAEKPGGCTLSDAVECTHGGFLYETTSGPMLYKLAGADTDASHSRDGKLGRALIGLRESLVQAQEVSQKEAERRAFRRDFARKVVTLAIALLIYYAVGCLVLCAFEPWTIVQAAYFITVSMSTVGYGDYAPSSTPGRVFVVLLIAIGIVVIFARLTDVIVVLTAPVDHQMTKLMTRLIPRRLKQQGESKLERGWIFYTKGMLSSLLMNVVLQLVSALGFVYVENMDYGTAVWHCIVTATTVGYGDTKILTPTGQIWASVHILLSVSMLGDAIATVDNLTQRRRADLKYDQAVHRELDQRLIETLEMRAAQLRPEISRDAEGLTELEFAISMAVELGMVEMKSLQPFLAQFRTLDVDGNGRVGMKDLQVKTQLKQMLEQNKREEQKKEATGGSVHKGGSLCSVIDFSRQRAIAQQRAGANRIDIEGRKLQANKPQKFLSAAHERWVSAGARVRAGSEAGAPSSNSSTSAPRKFRLRRTLGASRAALHVSQKGQRAGPKAPNRGMHSVTPQASPSSELTTPGSGNTPPRPGALQKQQSSVRWKKSGLAARWSTHPGRRQVAVVGGSVPPEQVGGSVPPAQVELPSMDMVTKF